MANTYKVLIVDDDVFFVEAMTRVFTQEKYGVEIALNGEDGLKKVKSFKPDIVLLDMIMPKMDGMTVLREMRKDPSTSDIPVVIVTNLQEEQKAEESVKLGVVLLLIKVNNTPTELFRKVQEILEKKPS